MFSKDHQLERFSLFFLIYFIRTFVFTIHAQFNLPQKEKQKQIAFREGNTSDVLQNIYWSPKDSNLFKKYKIG